MQNLPSVAALRVCVIVCFQNSVLKADLFFEREKDMQPRKKVFLLHWIMQDFGQPP